MENDAALSRKKILDAFGVTEEEMAELESRTGWEAARVAAERRREEFIAVVRQHANRIAEELGKEIRGD
jgi:hypothetical protein